MGFLCHCSQTIFPKFEAVLIYLLHTIYFFKKKTSLLCSDHISFTGTINFFDEFFENIVHLAGDF